jgi:hypothetical protein
MLLVLLWLETRYPMHATAIKSVHKVNTATLLVIAETPEAKCHAGLLVALAVLFHVEGNYKEAANCFKAAVR